MRKGFKRLIILCIQIIFMAYALSLIYPFIWMFINSFKANPEFYKDIWSLPKELLLDNYVRAWNSSGLGHYFSNSIFITVVSTFLIVMTSAMASYVVARFDFFGKTIIFYFSVISFLIPSVGSLGALYKLMIQLHLFNTHLGLIILYSGGLGLNFIILYGFFKGISWSYAEAAYMDGASDWQIFYKIMMPLAKPGIGAVTLVSMINVWNDYFIPFIFLQEQKLYTVSVGLYYMINIQQYASDWTALFAALTISTLPVLIAYLILQEKLISGFTTGGLKG